MSIILKGIDLPTDRKPYAIEVIYRFEGADGLFSEKNYLSPNEAIQIPKGHGKLIDEKELKTKIHDVILEGGVLHGCIDKTVLHEVPTILAEEG